MNTDSLFKELDPPPGGVERFARRLDELAARRPSARGRLLAMAAAAAVVALATATLVLRQPDDSPPVLAAASSGVDVYNAPELDRLLGRSPLPAELVVKVNMEAANVTQIETTSQNIRIYQIN